MSLRWGSVSSSKSSQWKPHALAWGFHCALGSFNSPVGGISESRYIARTGREPKTK